MSRILSERAVIGLYAAHYGTPPASIVPLRADGSNRLIWRLIDADARSVVGFFGPDDLENRAFLSFTKTFRSLRLPVPEIIASDVKHGVYLEEDLGDVTLLKAVEAARTGSQFPEKMLPTYRRVLELLAAFQIEGGRAVNFDDAYPVADFDRRGIMWDLNYFKYDFLKLADIPFHEARLEADFERLADSLLEPDRSHFMYRDFQPRNIMLRGGEPFFIDYQGGRRGALQYDVASLLYSSKSAMPDAIRDGLLGDYLAAIERYVPVDRESFVKHYRGYVVLRILQLLGAYGFRGYFERKRHFLESIPHAVRNVEGILAAGLPVDLPELTGVLERVVAGATEKSAASNGRTLGKSPAAPLAASVPAKPLTIEIRSFSYKQGGYPAESSEHGGGFVFDCRSLNNPGRYPEFVPLCGLDAPVVAFLEAEPAVESFFSGVWTLISGTVRTYLERRFEHISVSFGCTGGQHRSVYFAERLARSLRSEYPEIIVEVSHRESHRWPPSSRAAGAESE